MVGWLRYCVSSRKGVTPPPSTMREYSDSDRPRSSASVDWTVGGSWHWSPTRTSRWVPRRISGTTAASSVACAASSTRMPAKANFEKKSPPEEIVVVHMTSASCRMRICRSKSAFMLPLPLPLPLPFLPLPPPPSSSEPPALAGFTGVGDLDLEMALSRFFVFFVAGLLDFERDFERKRAWYFRLSSSVFSLSRRHSSVISSRTRLILSGRPTRTAFTPSFLRPIAMLSTATLLSEVARSGDRSNVLDHIFMICTETCVLPVPGGPWITVQVCRSADLTASRCDWLR
mmetsp:Transcript_56220/g.159578  ORF Transcript_56220/g.159578 Transcript_56220/m.159578 type:complete len:287 (+) Transcript_56220:1049-1909(+)